MFVATPDHEGRRADDFSNGAVVYQLPTGLVSAAQKGVGRAADSQVLFFGERVDLKGFIARNGERFFRCRRAFRLRDNAA